MAIINFLVGGVRASNKNLWLVDYDTVAQTLTVSNSWDVGTATDVLSLAKDSNGNLYVGTEEGKVYKYTPSMVLDATWAVGGIYNFGSSSYNPYGLAADSFGWLAIAHTEFGTPDNSVTLLNASGVKVWDDSGQSGATIFSADVRFLPDGNIIGCGTRSSGSYCATRYLRSDGTKKVALWARATAGQSSGMCMWPNGDYAIGQNIGVASWTSGVRKFDKEGTAYWAEFALDNSAYPQKLDYDGDDNLIIPTNRASSLSIRKVAANGASLLASYDTGANSQQIKVERGATDYVFCAGFLGTDQDAGGGNVRAFDVDLNLLARLDISSTTLWALVLGTAPPAPDPATTIWDGLQGAWPLDDDAADAIVQDISGQSNTGTASRNTNLLHATGQFGGAFDFDQSLPDNVNCGDINNIDLAPNQDIAIAFWMKRGTIQVGKYGTLIHKYKVIGTLGFAIYCDDDTDQVGVTVLFPTQYTVATSAVDIDNWALVVVNIDRNGFLEIIVNNGAGLSATDISSKVASDASSDVALMFGQNCQVNANYDDYDGLLDAVEVWNRCLTWDEINYLYTEGLATLPEIIDQSSDTTVNEGDPVSLFVTATGNPDPSYQWYFDDGGGYDLMPGETNSTLSFTADRTDAGHYKCRAYNVVGEDWSDPIELTVQYLEITVQPSSIIVAVGRLASFSITAMGVPAPTYQWYKDDVILPGETNSSLSFYCNFGDAGSYTCKVTNVVGEETSDPATLDVIGDLVSLEGRDLEINCEFDIDVTHSVALDLMQLMPAKFRNSQILIDFVDVAELYVGDWLTSVRDIIKLLNSRSISSRVYLRNLGALIGVNFPPEDTSTEDEMRKTLDQAIEWYKLKGTYKSIQVVALIQQFAINVYDMYTDDYSTFKMVDWFVGDEGENPPGFDASYYKSPHFGVEILLNKVYGSDSPSISGIVDHLWEVSKLDNLSDRVEETRPVHTVPHYVLLLNPKTDEFGNIVEVSGEIKAKIMQDWQKSTKYFDGENSDEIWDFDDGTYFDDSTTAFIQSITKWKFGKGGQDVSDPSFDITAVVEGNIDPDDITIADDKITFEFIVPKSEVQDGLNELGLYVPGAPDLLVFASSFPLLDKDSRVEIKVLVEVYRESLA